MSTGGSARLPPSSRGMLSEPPLSKSPLFLPLSFRKRSSCPCKGDNGNEAASTGVALAVAVGLLDYTNAHNPKSFFLPSAPLRAEVEWLLHDVNVSGCKKGEEDSFPYCEATAQAERREQKCSQVHPVSLEGEEHCVMS